MMLPFLARTTRLSTCRLGLLLALLAALCAGPAAAQTWQRALAVGQTASGSSATVMATAADASGNVYLAGNFVGTVSFGATTLTAASPGFDDVFVAKWSTASSSFVWALRGGGTDIDRATGLAVRGSSVYVVGNFGSASASFGPTTLANASATFSFDAFVAKLTDAGPSASFAWAQRAGGPNADRASGVAVSGSSVYVSGWFESPTATFGTLSLANTSNRTTGVFDAYVAKLTDAGLTGTFAWVQPGTGPGDEYATGVAANGANVYVVGNFASPTATFGGTALANAGNTDIFVAKLTDAGATGGYGWALRAGGTDINRASAVAVSGSNVYVAGDFDGAVASFAGFSVAKTSAPGSTDVYLAKVTDAGATGGFGWVQKPGNATVGQVYAVAAAGTSLYVAGDFSGASGSFLAAGLTDAGSTATLAWTQRTTGTGGAYARGVALVGSSVYFVGYVSPPVSFGTQTIAAPTGTYTSFMAALDAGVLATRSTGSGIRLDVVPNPARDRATVPVPAALATTAIALTLTDALGRPVWAQVLPAGASGRQLEVPLAGLAPGLYHLLVQAGSARATQTLQVE